MELLNLREKCSKNPTVSACKRSAPAMTVFRKDVYHEN